MPSYSYIISRLAHDKIHSFYTNVARKYSHTYSISLMIKNINEAYDSIYSIENGLPRRRPIMNRWAGYHMANYKKWYYAYRIDGNTIYVVDACHSQNIHDSIESKSNLLNEHKLNKIVKSVLHKELINQRNEKLVNEVFQECKRRMLNEGKYKVVGFDEEFEWSNGDKGHSLITLSNGKGISRVVENDGCYVLYQKVGEKYIPAPFIYPEAFNAMVDYLPKLPLR